MTTPRLLLRERDRQRLIALLNAYLPDITAWAYGSRVNGTAHDASDLDLVLRSADLSPIPAGEFESFLQALRESNIPILIEARDWARLPSAFHQEILKKYVVVRTGNA
ncbi:MAG: nucleotidyltransferase domain-containing protein [Gammaproteobacteria bacterium]|nr:nucleotidyltransferase domain-containing protein [Pseudomonadota bacterium]QOJ20135.1 MAG: nucleotidyltransferase domain-containing protein [Gammaproteobacteria bacterium]